MADAQESRLDEMERSLGAIQTDMREQIARTRVNTRVVLIVGLIVVVIVIAYMSWLFGKMKDFADPRGLADDIMRIASEKAPDLAKQLGESLKKNAVENVKKMEEMALRNLPDLRAKAIALAKEQLTKNAPQLRKYAIEQGRAYLKENAQKVRQQLATAGKEYAMNLLDQLPDLREKAWKTIHTALDQIPEIRKKAEDAAIASTEGLTETLDKQADAIVDELLTKKLEELRPLIQQASAPDGGKALAAALTKSLEEIVGTKMDSVLKEFDATLTPYEQYLQELLVEKLTPEQKLHREMITSVLLILDDALALGQLSIAPAPAPVVPQQ